MSNEDVVKIAKNNEDTADDLDISPKLEIFRANDSIHFDKIVKMVKSGEFVTMESLKEKFIALKDKLRKMGEDIEDLENKLRQSNG